MGKGISKELMEALRKETCLASPTIYAKIGEIASDDGNGCDLIIYALEYVQRNNLNPRKFADQETLDEYKEYRRSMPKEAMVITKTRIMPETKVTTVRFSDPEIPEINLPSEKVSEAKRMGEIYPYIYVLENSVRELIKTTLESIHGPNWWENCASTETKKKALDRTDKQGKSRYYGSKAAHPIYLVDFDDLRNLMIKNWTNMEPKLPKLPSTQAWVINILQMIEETRNIIAHDNPISKDDELKLKVNFKDWAARITVI